MQRKIVCIVILNIIYVDRTQQVNSCYFWQPNLVDKLICCRRPLCEQNHSCRNLVHDRYPIMKEYFHFLPTDFPYNKS